MNPTLVTILEMAFTAPAGMDLGLDDKTVTGKTTGDGFGLFRSTGDGSAGNGDTR